MAWKIVDDFNGYEGPSFEEIEEAQALLAKNRKAFFRHPGQQNALFRQTIVPSQYRWYFHPVHNKFIWGE